MIRTIYRFRWGRFFVITGASATACAVAGLLISGFRPVIYEASARYETRPWADVADVRTLMRTLGEQPDKECIQEAVRLFHADPRSSAFSDAQAQDTLLRGLRINQESGQPSRWGAFKVTVRSGDPSMACGLANAYVSAIDTWYLESARDFFDAKFSSLVACQRQRYEELGRAESALRTFLATNAINSTTESTWPKDRLRVLTLDVESAKTKAMDADADRRRGVGGERTALVRILQAAQLQAIRLGPNPLSVFATCLFGGALVGGLVAISVFAVESTRRNR